ncbi:MAG: hypothetical protein VX868_03880 [Chloroflexota bacterium]|nr:hypothetical protein [Chloroflexota bacterium]
MSLLDLYQRRLRGEYSTGPHNDNTVGSTTLSEEQIKKATGKSGLEKFSPISQAQGIQKGDSQVPSANDHIGPEPREVQPPPQEPIRPAQVDLNSRQTIHGLKENLSSIDEKLSQMGSAELRRTRDYHELKHRKSEVQNRLDRFNR